MNLPLNVPLKIMIDYRGFRRPLFGIVLSTMNFGTEGNEYHRVMVIATDYPTVVFDTYLATSFILSFEPVNHDLPAALCMTYRNDPLLERLLRNETSPEYPPETPDSLERRG